MTLLELMQEFCRRTGLPRPAVVASSQDDMLLQLTGLLNEVVVDLVTRFRWEVLSSEAVWSAVAGEDQGAMTTLAPGFDDMVPNTFWNRSIQIQYAPSLSAAEWAAQKATNMTGFYQFRILRGHLYLRAAPTAGEQLSFEYRDNRAILSALSDRKNYFTADNDSSLLADECLLLGLRWRWKAEKGFPYAEESAAYERYVAERSNRNNGGRSLSMDSWGSNAHPGIIIPPGSWNLP